MKYFCFFLCIFTSAAFCCDKDSLDVNIAKDISARISLKNNDLLVVTVLDAGKQVNLESVDVSSDKKNHIKIEDYNRDGYKDFSIWHLDEGMGIDKVYRLFVFFPADGKFKEIKSACGDDFINVRVVKGDLINVFYEDNIPKSCSIPLDSLK